MGAGNSTSIIKSKGNQEFQQGHYTEAIQYYNAALQQSNDYIIISNRALCYIKLNLWSQAYDDCFGSLVLNYAYGKAHYRIALVYQHLHMHYDAYSHALLANTLIKEDPAILSFLQKLQSTLKEVHCNVGNTNLYIWGLNDLDGGKQYSRPTQLPSALGMQFHYLSKGLMHNLAISENSQLYCWGNNQYGQCGVGNDDASIPSPMLLTSLSNYKINAIACGAGHSVALTNDGIAFAWGLNSHGQCGVNLLSNKITTPIKIEGFNSCIKGIACGMAFTYALNNFGIAFSFGCNEYGQLGTGKFENTCEPKEIPSHHVITISCGAGHAIIIDNESKAWSVGLNSCGQLGDKSIINKSTFQLIKLGSNVCFSGAYCGEEYSLIVTTTRDVYSFGLNNVGQLGCASKSEISMEPALVKAMAGKEVEYACCSKSLVLAVTANGRIYKWGTDQNGNLCEPTELPFLKQIPVDCIISGRNCFDILAIPSDSKYFIIEPTNINTFANKKAVFKLQSYDKYGNKKCIGGERIATALFEANELGYVENDCFINDSGDGSYDIELRIKKVNNYVMRIFSYGSEIGVSPVCINIEPEQKIYNFVAHIMNYTKEDYIVLNDSEFVLVKLESRDDYGNIIPITEQIEQCLTKLTIENKEISSFTIEGDSLKIHIADVGMHELEIYYQSKKLQFTIEYPLTPEKNKVCPKCKILHQTKATSFEIKESTFQTLEENKDSFVRVDELHSYILNFFDANHQIAFSHPQISVDISPNDGYVINVGDYNNTEYPQSTMLIVFKFLKVGIYHFDIISKEFNRTGFTVLAKNSYPNYLFSNIDYISYKTIYIDEKPGRMIIPIKVCDMYGNECEFVLDGEIKCFCSKELSKTKFNEINVLFDNCIVYVGGGIYRVIAEFILPGEYYLYVVLNGRLAIGTPAFIKVEQKCLSLNKGTETIAEREEIIAQRGELVKEKAKKGNELVLQFKNTKKLNKIVCNTEERKKAEEDKRNKFVQKMKLLNELENKHIESISLEQKKKSERARENKKKSKRVGGGFIMPFK